MMGFSELFAKAFSIWRGFQTAKAMLKNADLLVLIDFPDFNLRVAKIAKRLGIPVVYYIGPQLWAWRTGRIKIIKERIDKMLVIFPFEIGVYQAAHVPCEFVGHPLLDTAPSLEPISKQEARKEKGWTSSGVTLGLLPGSRVSEIKRLLPVMLSGAEKLSREMPLQILIPVAPTLPMALIEGFVRSSPLSIRLVQGDIYSVLRASDAVVVASGTATLQAALTQTPMVIIYKVSRITYAIARYFVRIPFVGLVNIVAKDGLVPELIQENATPDRIYQEIKRILSDPKVAAQMTTGLRAVAAALGKEGSSTRAADAIYDLLMKKAVSQ